ncbi:MAG: competence/damage-inducible protein A [Gemmatimonadetes bacterium]|nr:competence/damage-inducible protein A [Gemmatimonadota bacterium]
MRVSLLAIGDEIVSGTTVDTNSSFVSQSLREVGVEVVAIFSVVDDEAAITRAVKRAFEEADLVVSTGGLGPTADDLTTPCMARLAGCELKLHEPSLRAIEERFRSRGIEMTPNNRKQALLPEGSEVIPNPIGTAPGFICPVEVGGVTRHVASFPGVPREMRRMVEETLIPWVTARAAGTRFASRVFSTFGLAESRLDELLVGVLDGEEGRLAFRAAFPRVQARITLNGADGDDLDARLDAAEARVRERLGHHLYGVGDVGMEEVVGSLLRELGLTLALAESCTGGLIGHRLTDVPGSSEYFRLGIIAYANEAKQALLSVSRETIETHGAVSVETAVEMARGARTAARSDLGLATTGIAGPGGGTAEKPIGTVCIAIAWEGGDWSKRFDLGARDRDWIKQMTAQVGLDSLRRHLLGR